MDTEDGSTDIYGVEMEAPDVERFLARRGNGVLSFADEDIPYGIPVSFGYDEDGERFVLQLVFGSDSRKRAFVEDGEPVVLVSYEWNTPYDWRSVIARGTLYELPECEEIEAAKTFVPEAKTASLAVFKEPVENLDAVWYEIRVDQLTGRESPTNGGDGAQGQD